MSDGLFIALVGIGLGVLAALGIWLFLNVVAYLFADLGIL